MIQLTAEQKERAQRIHREAIVIDTHCDTLMDIEKGVRQLGEQSDKGHIDLPRLKAALSIRYSPSCTRTAPKARSTTCSTTWSTS